jgi:hypothetical protein
MELNCLEPFADMSLAHLRRFFHSHSERRNLRQFFSIPALGVTTSWRSMGIQASASPPGLGSASPQSVPPMAAPVSLAILPMIRRIGVVVEEQERAHAPARSGEQAVISAADGCHDRALDCSEPSELLPEHTTTLDQPFVMDYARR